jgi:DNA-binding transcriptional LysR family regulator
MQGGFVGRKGVSLERLQTLCLVAEAGSIMAASKGDPNRQSLYSRQIKELEAVLQLNLLDRSTSPHRLTAEGAKLEQVARTFFDQVDQLSAEASGRGPTVRIGAGESLIQWLLLPALRGLTKRTGVTLQFRNLTGQEVAEAVRARRIDIGVLSSAHLGGDLEAFKLAEYGVVLVGRPPLLPSKGPISWADLQGTPLATLEGSGRLRRRLDELGRSPESGPLLELECTSYTQLLEVCEAGDHIAVLPEIATAAARKSGLAVTQVRELADFKIDLAIVWSKAASSANDGIEKVVHALKGGAAV